MSEDTERQILNKITPIFREVFEDDTLVVHPELDAHQVEAWDSLNHITLVVELETLFDLQFTTDELASMKNVSDLIKCFIKKGYSTDG
jgi:acyl carrier protein